MKNIKKDFLVFTISIFYFIYCLKYNIYLKTQIMYSIDIWLTKIIPALYPTLIIVDLIYNSNIPYYINKYLHLNYIYIISIISGSPTNAHLLSNYKEDITKYLSITKYTSLLFTYNILKNIFQIKIVLILIICNILTNLILTIYLNPPKLKIHKKNYNIINIIIKSISRNINTLIIILGTIIFFNTLPINLIDNKIIKAIILSFLELTSSLNYLIITNLPLNIKLLCSIITISTCGLCIEFQIKSIINDTSIKYKQYIKYRLYHFIIYAILVFISLQIL